MCKAGSIPDPVTAHAIDPVELAEQLLAGDAHVPLIVGPTVADSLHDTITPDPDPETIVLAARDRWTAHMAEMQDACIRSPENLEFYRLIRHARALGKAMRGFANAHAWPCDCDFCLFMDNDASLAGAWRDDLVTMMHVVRTFASMLRDCTCPPELPPVKAARRLAGLADAFAGTGTNAVPSLRGKEVVK